MSFIHPAQAKPEWRLATQRAVLFVDYNQLLSAYPVRQLKVLPNNFMDNVRFPLQMFRIPNESRGKFRMVLSNDMSSGYCRSH